MDANSVGSASQQQLDFMQLLITQLRHQNPLETMDNKDMASQIAQFSQLQQMESMSSSFAEVLTNTRLNYANGLIGRLVAFYNGEYGEDWVGEVKEVEIQDGEPFLKLQVDVEDENGDVNAWGFTIGLDAVRAIGGPKQPNPEP